MALAGAIALFNDLGRRLANPATITNEDITAFATLITENEYAAMYGRLHSPDVFATALGHYRTVRASNDPDLYNTITHAIKVLSE